jgi:uncharacterized protein
MWTSASAILFANRAPRSLAWTAIFVACLGGPIVQPVAASDALFQRLQPRGAISDFASLLNSADRAAIESRLAQLRQSTGAQVAVVTLPSLEGSQIDNFANRLFNKWGVGQKGKNNGVMLLVAVQERKARIEVGCGLESILPNALASQILADQLFPAFKQQRHSEGLLAAVERIAGILERGEPPAQAVPESPAPPVYAVPERHTAPLMVERRGMPEFFPLILLLFVVAVIAVVAAGFGGAGVRRSSPWMWAGPGWGPGWFGSGWGSGFGGFGSGGFGGFSGGGFGGGGFGGGGFSGGGFGGGCSTGGGASGGW